MYSITPLAKGINSFSAVDMPLLWERRQVLVNYAMRRSLDYTWSCHGARLRE